MRGLIRDGSTSFLIGLLFGDITGSSALIFGSRTLVTSSHSREAETNADGFAIDVMHRLGRPAKPTGELLLRVTGKEGKGLSIISSHPLSEDRLARMSREDRPASGPPLLTSEEWRALNRSAMASLTRQSLTRQNLIRSKFEPTRLESIRQSVRAKHALGLDPWWRPLR
jgi:predicted Zn-dependent protease